MDDLLTIGKINENGVNYKPVSIDVVELSRKVITNYNGIQLDGREIQLKVQGVKRDLELDPVLMEHVFSALISNAFKYSMNKPSPVLIIKFLKGETEILIRDFGIGIPADELKHIHDPFYRASNAIDIEGTGLGTAIIKEYVETNLGELEIDSKVNEYTEFKIVFKN